MEMLQCVRELKYVFDEEATETNRWNLEALQYLYISGDPRDFQTLAAAVEAAYWAWLMYPRKDDCPVDAWLFQELRGHNVPILRYVCEHMDPAFAQRTLESTARALAARVDDRRRWASKLWDEGLDWPLVLYLGRKLGAALPEALAQAKATRTERAVALAGVFWKARKQLCAEESRVLHREMAVGEGIRKTIRSLHGWMALWDVLARVPKELQEGIAVEAHLIIL
jgi:hypothetical protein